MAGIGFELKRLLDRHTFIDDTRAYVYAGIISSGPWIISILGILCLDFIKYTDPSFRTIVQQFQVSITYLVATSLIVSSIAQYSFGRYIADILFEKKVSIVIPNFNGVLTLIVIIGGVLGILGIEFFIPNQSYMYKLFMLGCFVELCSIWVTVNLVCSLRNYRLVLLAFFLGYGSAVVLSYLLRFFGLPGLLLGFFIGQSLLLLSMLLFLYYFYPSDNLISFDFLRPGKIYLSLIFSSLFYYLGIWIDKFLFWYNPLNSHAVIGGLRASIIYDIPIFLAYLLIIPGMAVFLLNIETDFIEKAKKYYGAILGKSTYTDILYLRDQLVGSARQGIVSIIKVQGLVIFMTFILAPDILRLFDISGYYAYLLNIDVVGTSLLMVFLGLMNLFFYIDRRLRALWLALLFFVLNLVFTLITLRLGVFFFGYGFVVALLITCVVAALLLNSDFNHLEFQTFMKRPKI